MVKIGIIGGSGLGNPELIEDSKDIDVKTPYGNPSSNLKIGKIKGTDVVFLARHGTEHTIPPTHVNSRANIHALKEQGCTHIIATTAVGSLKNEIERGHIIIPDQFIDFTKLRKISFHDEFKPHAPKHTSLADPFDEALRKLLISACDELQIKNHNKGTVITIEGPRFSTRAESRMFQLWGADVINMSTAPEAILAREAGIPYVIIAMSTDYDCWKVDEKPTTWDEIQGTFEQNIDKVTKLLISAVPRVK